MYENFIIYIGPKLCSITICKLKLIPLYWC